MYFLAGLPRSGNTLLSALFNQNPNIYSSPISPLVENLWNLHRNGHYEANVANQENNIRHHKAIVSYAKSYYADIDKPIIFDREKEWGTPHNISLIKSYITDKPKIVATVRNILDILASMINVNKTLYLNEIKYNDFHGSYYLSENDAIAEYLMRPGGLVDKSLLSVSSSIHKNNKGMFHLVEYNDLVNDTQDTLNNIYDFLEIERFEHQLFNIKKREVDNDAAINLSPRTHMVHSSIVTSKIKPEKFFSSYIINKYSNIEFWRDPSILFLNKNTP